MLPNSFSSFLLIYIEPVIFIPIVCLFLRPVVITVRFVESLCLFMTVHDSFVPKISVVPNHMIVHWF